MSDPMTADAQDREAQERVQALYGSTQSLSLELASALLDQIGPALGLDSTKAEQGEVTRPAEMVERAAQAVYAADREWQGGTGLNYDDHIAEAVLAALDLEHLLAEAEKRGRIAGARETERAWQYNGWADVLLPKTGNPMADAQRVTEWLRARADQEEAR